eukprot:TRINITY_DN5527_c0_g3_i1.p1 TRINITY_DN5527_c0_g3~~TRINITY_DN5527_c0_g3_i1.p1  ORF type:complete len:128 (-),score=15.33 TRINITY_DN5527_c0_g3_i1:46-429(-)
MRPDNEGQLLAFLSGLSQSILSLFIFESKPPKSVLTPTKPKRCQLLSWEEVQQHNNSSSCWVVVQNKVYDVAEFIEKHPGGPVIREFGGRDATDVFSAFHSKKAWRFLDSFLIGEIEDHKEISAGGG